MGSTLLDFGDLLDLPGVVIPPGGGPSAVPFTVAPPGATLRQAGGQARRYGLDLADGGRSLAGVFATSNPPPTRAGVWGGADGAPLATPATSWADVGAAQLYLDVLPADLAGLELQPYPVRVEVMTVAGWLEAWSGTLRPDASPGTAAARPVYCPYGEMLAIAGDSLDQLRGRSEGAGLERSRAEAREWLDGVILARYRPAWGGGGFSAELGLVASSDGPDPYLRSLLDAGALRITPKVARIAATKALGIAYGRQRANPEYRRLAAEFHAEADAEALTLVAEICPGGAAYPWFTINCGLFSTRSY